MRPLFAGLVLLAAAVAFAGEPRPASAPAPASASTLPADNPFVVYRSTVMGVMGKHMKAAGMVVKGQIDRKGDLLGHAEALAAAGKEMAALWPAGTGPDKVQTDALPAVWTDAAGFAGAVAAYQEATARLVDAAKKDDKVGFAEAYGAVGQSCGGCHQKYRAEE